MLPGVTLAVVVKGAPAVTVTLAVEEQPPLDAVTVYVVVAVTAVASGLARVSCPVMNVEGDHVYELIGAGVKIYILPFAGTIEFVSFATEALALLVA